MTKRGFSSNVLPVTPLDLRRRPRERIAAPKFVVRGPDQIARIIAEGRSRRKGAILW